MTATLATTDDVDWLAAVIIHDGVHASQWREMDAYKREKKASSAALDMALTVGLSEETIQALCRDVKYGHGLTPFKRIPMSKTTKPKKRP